MLKEWGVVTDSTNVARTLAPRLNALAFGIAAFAGALTALVSLHFHVPAWVASLRGATAYLCVFVAARLLARFVVWSCDEVPTRPSSKAPQ